VIGILLLLFILLQRLLSARGEVRDA